MKSNAERALAGIAAVFIGGLILSSPEGFFDGITNEHLQYAAAFGIVTVIALIVTSAREDHTLRMA